MKRYIARNTRLAKIVILVALMVLVFSFVPSLTSAADQPSIDWQKTYTGFQATSIIQTLDGGYAMAGTSLSPGGATLIKTDSSGNVQWQKTLGDAASIVQTPQSNLVVFLKSGEIITTDSQGNTLSSFSVGANRDGVRQGIITDDETYIVVGNSIREGQETFVWLRQFDAQGTMLWDMNFTGGFEISAIAKTVDRGVVLAGNWKNNFWLARLDSNGNQQWSQNYVYGDPLDAHLAYSVASTKDGGFILAGTGMWQSSGGMIPWLIKINAQGYEQWSNPFTQYVDGSFSSVIQTASEGYYVVQTSTGSVWQTDSSGSVQWQEQSGISPIARPLGYPASQIISTSDGGYAVVGSTPVGSFIKKLSPDASLLPPTVTVSSPEGKTYDTGDLPLTFTVNSQNAMLSYVLDGQQAVAITGNVTLTKLNAGSHNITIYATNSAGIVGSSQTIPFTIVAPFPMDLVYAGIAIAAIAAVGFLIYLKRLTLFNFKKQDLKNLVKKQSLARTFQSKIVLTVVIIALCFLMIFVQFFFPYYYYSSAARSNSSFEVGVSYVYERDSADMIYNQVAHIKDLGIKVIRVNLVCDSSNPSSYLNTLSDVFFSAVMQVGVKVALIVNNHDSTSDVNYYLDKWGGYLTYIQVLNEPDVASSWQMGALFTDDEAGSKFQDTYAVIASHQLPVQYYTNFSPAFVARTNLPIKFSEKLDFVGFDVFMDSFLTLSPTMVQLLQKITHKDVVISEFGMSTSNDATQADYIIKGLNLFKNMGLKGCWIVYWNGADNDYGIRGRLAEQKIGEWIAQNA